jgi:hypothetical protein
MKFRDDLPDWPGGDRARKMVFSLGSASGTLRTGAVGFRVQNHTRAVIAGGAGIKIGAAFYIVFRKII